MTPPLPPGADENDPAVPDPGEERPEPADDDGRGDAPTGHEDPTPQEPGELPEAPEDWRPPYELLEELRERFGGQIDERKGRLWFPHLLIRGAPGDTGARPL